MLLIQILGKGFVKWTMLQNNVVEHAKNLSKHHQVVHVQTKWATVTVMFHYMVVILDATTLKSMKYN